MKVAENAVSRSAGFDLHHVLPPEAFRPEVPLATVTVLTIIGKSTLVLVRLKKVADANWWIPPQGRMHPRDTALTAATRVLRETFGMNDHCVAKARIVPLAMFENDIPPERVGGKMVVKRHHVVGVALPSRPEIQLNHAEIKDFKFVEDPDAYRELTQVVAEKRPVKYRGIKESLVSARLRNLLTWSLVEAPEMVQ